MVDTDDADDAGLRLAVVAAVAGIVAMSPRLAGRTARTSCFARAIAEGEGTLGYAAACWSRLTASPSEGRPAWARAEEVVGGRRLTQGTN